MKSLVLRCIALVALAVGISACGTDTKTNTITKEVIKEVVPACSPTQPQGACDAGESCVDGACVATASLCSPTNLSGSCPDGQSCFAGGCVMATSLCSTTQTAGLCDVGSTCFQGACVATNSLCSTSNPTGTCAGGQVCASGICTSPVVDICEQQVYTAQPTIGAHTSVTGKDILNVGGLYFKDLSGNGSLDPYEDWRLLEICRARDLVGKMSLDQKIGVMSEGSRVGSGTTDGTIPTSTVTNLVDRNERYALVRVGSRSAQELAVYLNNVQELVEGQPLGIPVTITADPLHGFGQSTSSNNGNQSLSDSSVLSPWPYPLGLGAINDIAVTRAFGDLVREEFMAMGFRWQLGPMADLATEPRWARVQNTFGSNAYQVAHHVRAIVSGFQGVGDGGLRNGIAATMKHFPGAGPDQDGMDSHSYAGRFNVYPGNNFTYHQISFQAAVDVGVAAVMPCYSVFKGQTEYDPEQVGAGFSNGLITRYLKETMGFTGMVTGDWGSIGQGYNTESLSREQRAAMWLEAGSHQLGSDSETIFASALEQGYITEGQIDEAASKILEMSFKLGLFENPYVDPAATPVRSVENRTMGFEAQKKAIVMLVNNRLGSSNSTRILPIDGSRYRDANSNSTPDIGEYIDDTNSDGTIKVWYDGVIDGLVADTEHPDAVTDVFGEYDYTNVAADGVLPVEDAASLAEADIAILRITARKGVYFGLDAGVPLSFDGPFPGTSNDSTINASIVDRNRIIDALRVRDGYTDWEGTEIAAANPNLKIVVIMHMDRPGIVDPFIKGLTTLDETLGEQGSYPLVSDVANTNLAGNTGIDAFLVEFGAFDRAVLDFLFNKNAIEGWTYGQARLPMEIPSSDLEVEEQYEDLPADTRNPTFMLGAGMTY